MAKKSKEIQVAPAMDEDWRTRDDANKIMDHADLVADNTRFKRAMDRIHTAVRHNSRRGAERRGGR